MSLSAIHLPAQRPHPCRGLVILLHGWGANAQDLAELSSILNLGNVQFILPNAPFPHAYSPEGRMWYDLEQSDWQGLEASRHQLNVWLNDCIANSGLPPERVILAGFSQGGAMTLEVGLGRSLGGLIVLSGYLHPHLMEAMTTSTSPVPPPMPIAVLHGQQDMVVPYQAALQTRAALEQWGANFQFVELDMGHEINPIALGFMREFIQACLPELHSIDE